MTGSRAISVSAHPAEDAASAPWARGVGPVRAAAPQHRKSPAAGTASPPPPQEGLVSCAGANRDRAGPLVLIAPMPENDEIRPVTSVLHRPEDTGPIGARHEDKRRLAVTTASGRGVHERCRVLRRGLSGRYWSGPHTRAARAAAAAAS